MIAKEFPARTILTTRGVLDANDVLPGDFVYEWRTGNLLEVKEIKMMPFYEMFKLVYSDGRYQYIVDPECIYLDQWTLPPHHPFCKCTYTRDYPIKIYPIDFTKGNEYGIEAPLDPDPYVAGALCIHGDQDQEELNWDFDRTEANNQFSHKYNVDYYPLIGPNENYFQWKGRVTEERITWKEFFGDIDFHATNPESDKIIPDKYFYTSMKNRVQFIRGAFDMGYDETRSPDRVALYHTDRNKLVWVKKMLDSMGVSCHIYTDMRVDYKRKHWLEIQGPLNTWPGFFYHYDYIARMLNNSIDKCCVTASDQELYATVTLVDIVNMGGCRYYAKNPVPHIVLEREHMFYTSPNFLPCVSI